MWKVEPGLVDVGAVFAPGDHQELGLLDDGVQPQAGLFRDHAELVVVAEKRPGIGHSVT